jgi:hypothetical protein
VRRLVIEGAQVVLHEGHEPDLLRHILDANGLTREGMTQIDLAPAETDTAAADDRCDRGSSPAAAGNFSPATWSLTSSASAGLDTQAANQC